MSMPLPARRRGELLRAERHAQFLAGLANQGPFRSTSELLAGLEGERIISLNEAARLNGTSVDTIRRRHSDKIVKMSDKRVGMRLRHALTLAKPLNAV